MRHRREDGRQSDTRTANTAPAVRIVDRYLELGLEMRASDLHFEPAGNGVRVRARVDGVLRELAAPPDTLAGAMRSRLRLLAGVDLAERRLPQDGRFTVHAAGRAAGREPVDVRAAFLPAAGGEKITLRLLHRATPLDGIASLGLQAPERRTIERALNRSAGLIVVAGPTGSGKTTTLYAAIDRLRSTERAILTVEDPVEVELEGVTQVPVDDEVGCTFAAVLRAMLRQDPDVLMVGEMRDAESARIACRAALTGHLVLTSVHATEAGDVATRLIDMGVAPYLVETTVSLVVAQRLLRRLCPHCRRSREPLPVESALFGAAGLPPPRATADPVGCDACDGLGYRGRLGVFEFLARTPGGAVERTPKAGLAAAGLLRAARSDTSVAEVLAHCPPIDEEGPVEGADAR